MKTNLLKIFKTGQRGVQTGAVAAEYALMLGALLVFGPLALSSFQHTVTGKLTEASTGIALLGGGTDASTRGGNGRCIRYYTQGDDCFCTVGDVQISPDRPPVYSTYERQISCEEMPTPDEEPLTSNPQAGVGQTPPAGPTGAPARRAT